MCCEKARFPPLARFYQTSPINLKNKEGGEEDDIRKIY
jgi:hypothetical protein